MKLSPTWKRTALKFLSCFSFLCPNILFAVGNPTLQLLYQSESTQANTLATQGILPLPVSDILLAEVGLGLRLRPSELSLVEYKGEMRWTPFSWLSLTGRMSHARHQDYFHHTALTGILGLVSPSWTGLQGFFRGGFFKRFSSPGHAAIFPHLEGDFSTHDFVVELGADYDFAPWRARLKASTFDEFETYNLNHPFFEARIFYQRADWGELSLLARYHVTLGFGRLERFILGASITVPLETESPPLFRQS